MLSMLISLTIAPRPVPKMIPTSGCRSILLSMKDTVSFIVVDIFEDLIIEIIRVFVLEFGFYKADLYLMDADGSNRVRLTYFNEPGHPDYVGAPVQIQKEAWSPDGSRIVSAYFNHETRKSQLFMIIFEGPCGKL